MNGNTSLTPHGDDRTTVLIADDDEDILELVQLGLKDQGFQTIIARDGAAALALARERVPDLVLLDVSMPELDGYQVTTALKGDPATDGMVVILFTARAAPHDVEKGFSAGADDYIVKPFTLTTLQERVAAALARRAPAGS
jgi:DNA-binding response OmpR family regulator